MKAFLLICAVALYACDPKPTPPVPPSPPDPVEPGPGPEPVPDRSDCSTACENLRDLGCEVGQNTAEGSTCEDVCNNSFEAGITQLQWDVVKLSNASECE